MNICILGDSIAKGVLYDAGLDKYVTGKEGFADRLRISGMEVENFAVFGCTVAKGIKLCQRHESKIASADAVLLEFGGNDCDFHWNEIGADPGGEHLPACPVDEYVANYMVLIERVRALGAKPVVLNLPPIHSVRYYERFCRDMDEKSRENVLRWLNDDVEYIHNWHRGYNDRIPQMASELKANFIDIRSDFGESYGDYLCADGIHPNPLGQELIYKSLCRAGVQMLASA